MIAFKINREASNEVSEITNNNAIDDFAEDFRNNDNVALEKFVKVAKKLQFLKFIPFSFSFYKLFKNLLVNRKFKAKKYF